MRSGLQNLIGIGGLVIAIVTCFVTVAIPEIRCLTRLDPCPTKIVSEPPPATLDTTATAMANTPIMTSVPPTKEETSAAPIVTQVVHQPPLVSTELPEVYDCRKTVISTTVTYILAHIINHFKPTKIQY